MMLRLTLAVMLAMSAVSVTGKMATLVFKECREEDVKTFTDAWNALTNGASASPLENALQKYPHDPKPTTFYLGPDVEAVKTVLKTTVAYLKERQTIPVRCEYDRPLVTKEEALDIYALSLVPTAAEPDADEKPKKASFMDKLFKKKHKKDKAKEKTDQKSALEPEDPVFDEPVFKTSVRCKDERNVMSVISTTRAPVAAEDQRDIVVCPHYWRAIAELRAELSLIKVQPVGSPPQPAYSPAQLERALMFDTAGSFLHEVTHLAADTKDLAYGARLISKLPPAEKPKNADSYYFWWRTQAFQN